MLWVDSVGTARVREQRVNLGLRAAATCIMRSMRRIWPAIVFTLLASGCVVYSLLDVTAATIQAADRANSRAQAAENKKRAIMKTAADAARRGDCAAVGELADQVRNLDVAYHDTVFVHDIEIGRCLERLERLERAAEQRSGLSPCMQQRHRIFSRASKIERGHE